VTNRAGQGQGRHLPVVFSYRHDRVGVGQGGAARADTRPLFSVIDRARQGSQRKHLPVVFSYRQGRAGQPR